MASTKLKLRRDTSENWETINPTLLGGEMIVVILPDNEERLKIGNGRSTYKELPFIDEATRSLIDKKIGEAVFVSGGSYCTDDGNGNISMVPSTEQEVN